MQQQQQQTRGGGERERLRIRGGGKACSSSSSGGERERLREGNLIPFFTEDRSRGLAALQQRLQAEMAHTWPAGGRG